MMFDSFEQVFGLQCKIGFEVLIEEVEVFVNVEVLVIFLFRLEVLIFGFGDFVGSMGMCFGYEFDDDFCYCGDLWYVYCVCMFVVCCVVGIDVIDGFFGNFKNLKCYQIEVIWVVGLGVVGKWCIYLSQIELVNDVFVLFFKEIECVQQMVDVYNKFFEEGDGVGGVGGQFVDVVIFCFFQLVFDCVKLIGKF